MSRQRNIALVTAGIMAASIFTGCGNDKQANTADNTQAEAESTEKTAEKSSDKVIIKVTKWGDAGIEQELVDDFNATNDKNIEVQLDAIPGDGYGDRLTTSFSSGEGYDVFLSGEGEFYKWKSLGMITPLDEFIEKDTEWENSIPERTMNMGVVEDSQCYIVKDFQPICLWYNKDLFDQMNVDYPTDEWTWDDLYDAAQKLTIKGENGEYESFGFQAQSWAYGVSSYLESLGLSYVSDDYSTADGYLNSDEMAQALDTYFGWTEGEDRVSPNAADTDAYGDGTAMMINNKLAMFVSGGWAKTSLDEAGTNYGIALLPGNHISYFCTSGFGISSNCKNPDAAWEVIKQLTGEKASELRAEKEGSLPTAEKQFEKLKAELPDDWKALLESLDYSVPPVGMRGKVGNAINVVLDEVFEKIIYHEGDTKDILNETVDSLDIE